MKMIKDQPFFSGMMVGWAIVAIAATVIILIVGPSG
jgi:hypothetical protein